MKTTIKLSLFLAAVSLNAETLTERLEKISKSASKTFQEAEEIGDEYKKNVEELVKQNEAQAEASEAIYAQLQELSGMYEKLLAAHNSLKQELQKRKLAGN